MHKLIKETTHVRVGVGEKHTLIYKEYKYNVCIKMVTRPNVQEQCIYKRKKRKDT